MRKTNQNIADSNDHPSSINKNISLQCNDGPFFRITSKLNSEHAPLVFAFSFLLLLLLSFVVEIGVHRGGRGVPLSQNAHWHVSGNVWECSASSFSCFVVCTSNRRQTFVVFLSVLL